MLDELVATIETLKARINEHRADLQASEAQTRLSLIDPLLRALGWDTADPALVRPEFVLSTGRADYALLGTEQKLVAIIEAKKLSEPLGTTDRHMQMLTYAVASNVDNAILTDGDQWVMYRVFERQEDKRLALNISTSNTPSHECALNLLLLWYPNLKSGQPIKASAPVLGIDAAAPTAQAAPPATAVPAQTAIPEPQPGAPSVTVEPQPGWVSLKDLRGATGRKPRTVRLPNYGDRDLSTWKSLLVEVAEWLVRNGKLTRDMSPMTMGRKDGVYLINSQPKNDDEDKSGMRGAYRLSNGLYLAAHGSAEALVDRCRGLLTRLGEDPATIHVQVG